MVAAVVAVETKKKIKLDGRHSLADVARRVCGDVRLAALLGDLNPGVPQAGVLPAGTVVVVPTKTEAASFARKMGFTIGIDPRAENGTDAKRRFRKMVGTPSQPGPVDAAALARSLLSRAVSPAEAGRRLAKQCALEDIAALTGSGDPAVRTVAEHAEACALFPKAVSKLVAVKSVLEATARPAGLLALVSASARDAASVDQLLAACAVAPALRQAIAAAAPRVTALIAQAKNLADIERGARDASVGGDVALRKVVDALVDGVAPLAADRLGALGIEAEVDALVQHLQMLRAALDKAEEGLGRQPAAIIKALATGSDGARLPRPWPLLCQVVRDVGVVVDAVPATARDLGIGGLTRARSTSTEGAPVRITVAELQVRAAACARAVDEGEALAERLAPMVVALFSLMRPPPAIDGGTPQAKKARRRAAFDHAMGARGAVSGTGVAAVAAEILERARSGGDAGAVRLGRAQSAALQASAAEMAGPLTVHRQPMSELGRALVLTAMAVDREVGQGLSRPTGREAFVAAAIKHAGRVLSAASVSIGR